MPDHESADPRAAYLAGRTITMDRLAERDRSRRELLDTLARRRFPDDVAEAVVDQLCIDGLVDDGRFARAWVESRVRSKGLARPILRLELRQKGVDDDIIDAALADLGTDAERLVARALIERKLRSMDGLDPSLVSRRLVAMLGRKGYAPGVAFDLVREAVGSLSE